MIEDQALVWSEIVTIFDNKFDIVKDWTFFLRPEPKARPRHTIRGKGRKAFVQSYQPKSFYEKALVLKTEQERRRIILTCPLIVAIEYVFKSGEYGRPKDTKPDSDNLNKATFDGIKGVFHDDAQITMCLAAKRTIKKGEREHVKIKIYR